MALINSAGAHDEVFITGHSMGLPTQAVTEELAATYLSKYLSFADSRPEYEYVPCAPGSEASANALVANLRVALQSTHPTPGTIAWILRHCAAAAPSLIPGINGSYVGHLLHSWAMAADVAFYPHCSAWRSRGSPPPQRDAEPFNDRSPGEVWHRPVSVYPH